MPKVTRRSILDLFVIGNLAFLAVDIYLAHSINEFALNAEWVPIFFSLIAPTLLFIALILSGLKETILSRMASYAVGLGSVAVGIAGMFFHLESQFFQVMNIKSLVYTAPFIAPLAYVGIGFLLIMNRMVSSDKKEWGQWIIFFALAGIFGNYVLAICDHAQNGFFHKTEWIPVFVSAIGIGFLTTLLLVKEPSIKFIRFCNLTVILQILVGFAGFYLHLQANLEGFSDNIRDNFIYGAPIFAPLLFVDLALLALFGLWDLRQKVEGQSLSKQL